MIQYKIYNLIAEYMTNTYLIWDEESKEAALIDASAPSEQVADEILEKGLDLRYQILTHGHADHIAGIGFFKEKFPAPIMIHKMDEEKLTDSQKNLSAYMGSEVKQPQADVVLSNGERFQLGNTTFKIIHTPGHTPGGICLLFPDFVITGDTLFWENMGRTDLPGGNTQQLMDSIEQSLFTLPDKLIVLPGHGEKTTIEHEKVANPYVGLAARL